MKKRPYQFLHGPEAFKRGVANGERATIYPLLIWLLKHLDTHATRAYLGRFLQKVDVPPAFLHDEQVQAVHGEYKGLRKEFMEAHKTVSKLRTSNLTPGDLRKEITQLDEEKVQLKERIKGLRRRTDDLDGFQHVWLCWQ